MIFRCFNQKKKREFDFTIITTASHKFLILYNFFFSAILSIQQFDFKLILFFFVCFSLSLSPFQILQSNQIYFHSIQSYSLIQFTTYLYSSLFFVLHDIYMHQNQIHTTIRDCQMSGNDDET